MYARTCGLVLAAMVQLAPGLARSAGTIEGFYGVARPPSGDLQASLDGAAADSKMLDNSLRMVGGDIMFNVEWLQFGALGERTWASANVSQTALAGLLGIKLGLGILRIDLMGEAGARTFRGLGGDAGVGSNPWRGYIGVRPGLAVKLRDPSLPGLLIGVWTFARWDLNDGNPNPSALGKAGPAPGHSTIGASFRLGFDF